METELLQDSVSEEPGTSVEPGTMDAAVDQLLSSLSDDGGEDGTDVTDIAALFATESASEPEADDSDDDYDDDDELADDAGEESEPQGEQDWESAFKGLQATMQKMVEEQRQREAQSAQASQMAAQRQEAEFLESLKYQPPERAQLLRQAFDLQKAQNQVGMTMQQAEMLRQQALADREAAAVPRVVDILARRHRVPKAELQSQIEAGAGAVALEAYAKGYQKSRAKFQRDSRRASGADAFGRGGERPVTVKNPQSFDELDALVDRLVGG